GGIFLAARAVLHDNPEVTSILARDFGILGSLMAFANRFGAVYCALFRGPDRPLGLTRLLLDIAGLNEAALRFIVLAGCRTSALALIAWGAILLFWLFGHAKPPSPFYPI